MEIENFDITREKLNDNLYSIEININKLHNFTIEIDINFLNNYFLPFLYEISKGTENIQIDFEDSIGILYIKIFENKLNFCIRSFNLTYNRISEMSIYLNNNDIVKREITNFLIYNNFINFKQNKKRKLY